MTLLENIIKSGTSLRFSSQENRTLVLINTITLILCGALFAVFFVRGLLFADITTQALIELTIGLFFFALPLFLNRAGLVKISRIYLCWIPAIYIWVTFLYGMNAIVSPGDASYDGLRLYLLALTCIPFLLFRGSGMGILILGLLPTFLSFALYDWWMILAGIDFSTAIESKSEIEINHMRMLITYVVISGSCLALKIIIERSEAKNQRLISELESKNKIIIEQTSSEVSQLNMQLYENLEALGKRDLVLKKSQEIAKVGNWEFNLKDNSLFWSDEMYDIFGVDKSFDLKAPKLMRTLFGDYGMLVEDALQRLIATRETYDFTLETRTPVGYTKWVRIFGFPVVVHHEITSVSGIVQDVTYFKESEGLIRTNEKNYRSLFEQASDAIMITDLNGNFINVNESLCKMLGYTKAELIRTNIGAVIDPVQLKNEPIRFDQLGEGRHVFNERRMLRKDGSIVLVEANVKMFAANQVMAIARDITERNQAEKEKELARYLLKERLKELTTLYRAGQLFNEEHKSTSEILQELVELLPGGYQFTENCAARVMIGGMSFVTTNWTDQFFARQYTEINLGAGQFVSMEVVYVTELKDGSAYFLEEERDMINMVTEMLQTFLIRKQEKAALSLSDANLRATINNTELLIWSVDRNLRLLTFNQPFRKFISDHYNKNIQTGSPVLTVQELPQHKDAIETWETYYRRALSGEIITLEEPSFGNDFRYSLSPIIEDNQVIGVSAFADNITELNIRDRALADANKQIGELRLTALRSVMNPHFIFNALNSIQFFMAKNDRLNAINYLSTFSKLIRGILTNAIQNTIKLSEEIELLKHYINLELLRFDKKFTVQFEVDAQLDVDNIEIPTLLIQPYVENAILHGLYNKPEPGLLRIAIYGKGDGVVFEIEDNGIGRKAAAAIREKNFPTHKSMGTKLTEERLKLLNRHGNVSFDIQDLFADREVPAGTRIRIEINH